MDKIYKYKIMLILQPFERIINSLEFLWTLCVLCINGINIVFKFNILVFCYNILQSYLRNDRSSEEFDGEKNKISIVYEWTF